MAPHFCNADITKKAPTPAPIPPQNCRGGRTTAASLIPRFWDTTSGTVEVGGVDVRQIDPHVLMEQVAFVFQNNRLFKASVLDNVRAARPDATHLGAGGAVGGGESP